MTEEKNEIEVTTDEPPKVIEEEEYAKKALEEKDMEVLYKLFLSASKDKVQLLHSLGVIISQDTQAATKVIEAQIASEASGGTTNAMKEVALRAIDLAERIIFK